MNDESATVILSAPQLEALDAYRRSCQPILSRDEALQSILAEWLANTPLSSPQDGADEGLRPEELNASNDI